MDIDLITTYSSNNKLITNKQIQSNLNNTNIKKIILNNNYINMNTTDKIEQNPIDKVAINNFNVINKLVTKDKIKKANKLIKKCKVLLYKTYY